MGGREGGGVGGGGGWEAGGGVNLPLGLFAGATVWRKCLTGENFDEFDESKLHRQNFPYQYFAIE